MAMKPWEMNSSREEKRKHRGGKDDGYWYDKDDGPRKRRCK